MQTLIEPYWDALPPRLKFLVSVLVFFWLLLSILWIILPFAVFSMRGHIEKQNKILKSIEAHSKFQNEQIKKTHQKPHLS